MKYSWTVLCAYHHLLFVCVLKFFTQISFIYLKKEIQHLSSCFSDISSSNFEINRDLWRKTRWDSSICNIFQLLKFNGLFINITLTGDEFTTCRFGINDLRLSILFGILVLAVFHFQNTRDASLCLSISILQINYSATENNFNVSY